MTRPSISVVITDLDNTLYNWFEIWYQSFSAMLDVLVRDSGVPRDQLIKDIKSVHGKHQTSEYAFLIEELESLSVKHPGEDIAKIYDEAIHSYNKKRKQYLKLYPYVMDTLKKLKENGCLIIAYTESMEFYTSYRIKNLALDGIIDILYSPVDHDLPTGFDHKKRKYPEERYKLKHTKHRFTPRGEIKPNPDLLLDIINDVDASIEETIYIGDNLIKDVVMAKEAGIIDIYAQYGTAHAKQEYDLLRSVTHWKDQDVKKEKETVADVIKPSYILENNFSELLDLFDFKRFIGKAPISQESGISNLLEVWKTTIDVQKHFNELELKIRNYALTFVGAILGAVAFALKENLYITIGGKYISIGAFLIPVAFIIGFAFWIMDRHWYHRLLYGSVEHGTKVENALMKYVPEIGLTKTIGDNSPFTIFGKKFRSTNKIDLFYGMGGLALILLFFIVINIFPYKKGISMVRGTNDNATYIDNANIKKTHMNTPNSTGN